VSIIQPEYIKKYMYISEILKLEMLGSLKWIMRWISNEFSPNSALSMVEVKY
jgi:hypothetical protein